jgi:hypothetical protein
MRPIHLAVAAFLLVSALVLMQDVDWPELFKDSQRELDAKIEAIDRERESEDLKANPPPPAKRGKDSNCPLANRTAPATSLPRKWGE